MADNPLDTPLAAAIEIGNSPQWEMTPSFLNMLDVDLEQAAGVVATSPFLDLRGHFNYKLFVDISEVGSSLGDFKLTLEEFAPSQISDPEDEPTPIDSEDILTAIDSNTDGQKEVLLFGATIDPVVYSSGGGTGATLGSNIARFKMLWIARLKLEITTQATATSSTASVRFYAGD